MSETLSQADIDALLNTLADEEQGPPRPAEPDTTSDDAAATYDFSHPDLLSRDQIRSIRTLHEGYAQALAKRLSTEFLTNVSAFVVSVDHLTYGEFLMLLPTPTVLSVIEVRDLDGNIAIEMNPSISFAFIDRLLGGQGVPLGKVRPLTAIEQGLMERVLRKGCQELAAVWAPITTLEFSLQSIEANPELARVVGPNEMVVLVTLELKMNEVSGMMNLCLPYVVMEPALHRLGQGTRYPRTASGSTEHVRAALTSSVRTSKLDVEIDLGRVDLSLREILDLEPGDVLRFMPAAPTGAQGSVEGVPRLAGVPGRFRSHVAFEVRDIYPRDPDEEGKGHDRGA